MKKNVLIVVLVLLVVGGGGFIAGERLGEKNAAPETTVENTTFEAVVEQNAPEVTTEKVEEMADPETEKVIVTEKVYVTEKREEPKTEAVEPTEKITEPETKVNKKPEQVKTTSEAVDKISRDEAKKIALNHAGLKDTDVRGLEVELDFERGAYEYEVSFESGKYEYDYKIDAISGKIKLSEKEIND